MKQRPNKVFTIVIPLVILGFFCFFGTMFKGDAAWGIVVVPPPALNPLNQTPVPQSPQIFTYVKNRAAAVRLGKAFFWDMQVGSDGIVACATCHHGPGMTDKRLKNTLNPGTPGGDTIFGNNSLGVPGFPQFGPNYTLDPVNDFPLHRRQGSGHLQTDPIIQDTNDVVGSQGVRLSDFVGVGAFADPSVDSAPASEADPIFHDPAYGNLRRVTGRNAPTVIDAAFNFSNFWDGRANFRFNGENPFGPADPNAGIWFDESGQIQLVKRPIVIDFASLASQSTGPPLDSTEMSGRGRTFPDIGRKLLNNGLIPLGKQLVHPRDSVLGVLSNAVRQADGSYLGNGLNQTYTQMIQEAFLDKYWNSPKLSPTGYTQMEANFSLFWGLAIQLYEATLVSDDTPFDSWLGGNDNAINENQKFGFSLFEGIGNCTICHLGIEFTDHSVAAIAFTNNFISNVIELMFVSDGVQVIYDEGYTNNAIRPYEEDLGRGGAAPFTNPLDGNQPIPLSFSRLGVLQALGLLPFETPILPPFIPTNMPVNALGAFKVPGLRNVALTGPYFHNGSEMTLDGVLNFYSRGGNFPAHNIHELDPVIGAGLTLIQNNQPLHEAIQNFLTTLTDGRAAAESAPFDHPELFLPEGDPEVFTRLLARDLNGQPALPAKLTVNLLPALTNQAGQSISGAKDAGTTVQVKVNNGLPLPADTTTNTTWSTRLNGLVEGSNTITIIFTDSAGTVTNITKTMTIDTIMPVLTLNALPTSIKINSLTLSGTVEEGIEPVITVSPATVVSPVEVNGTNWNAQIIGLTVGAKTITVKVTDQAGNNVTRKANITVVAADGNLDGGVVSASDALLALRMVVGLANPTADNLLHGDVAPLFNSVPAPDGRIDVGDALVILRKAAGLINF